VFGQLGAGACIHFLYFIKGVNRMGLLKIYPENAAA